MHQNAELITQNLSDLASLGRHAARNGLKLINSTISRQLTCKDQNTNEEENISQNSSSKNSGSFGILGAEGFTPNPRPQGFRTQPSRPNFESQGKPRNIDPDEFFTRPAENVGSIKTTEIFSKISESNNLWRQAEKSLVSLKNQEDFNHLIEQGRMGKTDSGIGTRLVHGTCLKEWRAGRGARIYFEEINGRIEIATISDKNNQTAVIKVLKVLYKS